MTDLVDVKANDTVEVKTDNAQPNTQQTASPRNPPNDVRLSTEQLNQVLGAIKDILQGRKLDKYNILRVVLAVMRVLDGFKTLTGNAKKNLLMNSLETYIDEDPNLLPEEKLALAALLESVVSEAIDLFCEIANEVKKSRCFASCFGK